MEHFPEAQRATEDPKEFNEVCGTASREVNLAIAVPGWWTQGLQQSVQFMNYRMLIYFITARRGNGLRAREVSIVSQIVSERNCIEPIEINSDISRTSQAREKVRPHLFRSPGKGCDGLVGLSGVLPRQSCESFHSSTSKVPARFFGLAISASGCLFLRQETPL